MAKKMTDENKKKEIEELRKFIITAEDSLESAKKALADLTGEDISAYRSSKPSKSVNGFKAADGGKIIEGVFNGENMIGPEGKVYPVPANYASKSKLVEGDKLKLTVVEDGSFIFKQIGPTERKNIVGSLVFEDNMYQVNAEGKRYNILYASVTYYKAKPGDRVTITVPSQGDSEWAALENIIHNVSDSSPAIENIGVDNESSNIDTSIFDINKNGSVDIEKKPDVTQDESTNFEDNILKTNNPDDLDRVPSQIEEKITDGVEPKEVPLPLQPQKSQIELEQENASEGALSERSTEEQAQSEVITQPLSSKDIEEISEGQEAKKNIMEEERIGLPEESFLPRSNDDKANNLGEVLPGTGENSSDAAATELEI